MKVKKLIYLSLISILMAAFTACTNDVSSDSPAPAKPEKTEKPPVENPPEKIVFQGTDYTVLEDGEDGTAGKKARYVLFGDWPQTIKDDDVTVDESVSVQMGGFTYYKGSDGAWYAKCLENARLYRDFKEKETKYSNGKLVGAAADNTTQYFKVEPIKWRVLNFKSGARRKLLLAEKALVGDIPFYGFTIDSKADEPELRRSLNNKIIYQNNYEYSNIRAFLNGIQNQFVIDGGTQTKETVDWTNKGFYQTAFTEIAQSKIMVTEVDNTLESTYHDSNENVNLDYVCNNTNDKIFLLSVKELSNTQYGFADTNSKRREPTDYTKANYAYCEPIKINQTQTYYTLWFLRSPCFYHENWVYSVDSGSNSRARTSLGDTVIVPALYVYE